MTREEEIHKAATKSIPPYMDYDIKEDKGTFKPSEGTLVAIDLTRELRIADEVEVILGDYEFVLKDGKTYFVKKNKFPKTYEECCRVLGISDGEFMFAGLSDDEYNLFDNFIMLKRCRDAYWKIAGEQMGLGKPWKPDYCDEHNMKYIIYICRNKINLSLSFVNSHFLAFPTSEIRDAFYNNFNNLIEQCKELL